MKQGKKNRQPVTSRGNPKRQEGRGGNKNAKFGADKKKYINNEVLIIAGIIVLTVIAYYNAIGNKFINWDEDEYIVENPVIRSFNLKTIFTHYLAGNYHPVTELVYAIQFHLWGLKESGYHIVCLLLHICNAVFVFYTILLLSKKTEIATVAAMLFAVHPMHVESVAWVAELKDLLYTFFFLASYICYLKYMADGKKKLYLVSIILFLLSLLSKGMAASFPVVLLLTDYFIGRKTTGRTLLEKAPFFILAIIFGAVAIIAQRSVSAIQEIASFPFHQQVVFACYGFITYFYKLLLPLNLSAFYPYPIKSSAGGIPSWYYIFPFLLVLLVVGVIYSLRYSKKIFFGVGFFAITVFLVLQLLPVGNAIMADRYSYIPSIGFFYLVGEGFYWLYKKGNTSNNFKMAAIGIITVIILFFSYTTYARCNVWKNGMTLWDDMISKYPEIAFAHNNRGILYIRDEKYDDALQDFNIAIGLQPFYPRAYNNRGIVYSHQKKFEEAKLNFDKAIQQQSNYDEAYANRGIMLNDAGKYADAIQDLNKAIELKPNSPQVYYNRARAEYSLGKKDAGCADLVQAINLKFESAQDAYNHLCH